MELPLITHLSERVGKAQNRDKEFISQLNLRFMDNLLWPLYVAFVCLNFLDIYSTLLAMNATSAFRELNPIAAVLFGLHFHGFLMATFFKYLPAIPLFYVTFANDRLDIHAFELRMVKFAGICALFAADILLVYVVGVNNVPTLVTFLSRQI